MALDEKTENAVSDILKEATNPIKLSLFGSENNEYVGVVKDLLIDITKISNISLETFSLESNEAKKLKIMKEPVLIFNDFPNARFMGVPSGHEFRTLLETIIMVSKKKTKLEAALIKKIKTISTPVDIKVFVTPTCPYCPPAVIMALQMAIENPLITGQMIEAMEFPTMSKKFEVMGVPKTVINESGSFEGAVPPHIFVQKVMENL